MKKFSVFVILTLAFGIVFIGGDCTFAAEGGVGHYVPGAKLGSFETEMTGVGPVLSCISPPICGRTIVAGVKRPPQMDTLYTLKGYYLWFKVGLAF